MSKRKVFILVTDEWASEMNIEGDLSGVNRVQQVGEVMDEGEALAIAEALASLTDNGDQTLTYKGTLYVEGYDFGAVVEADKAAAMNVPDWCESDGSEDCLNHPGGRFDKSDIPDTCDLAPNVDEDETQKAREYERDGGQMGPGFANPSLN